MRLLPSEHSDLLSSLEVSGISKEQYGFRKKAGWFRIDVEGKASSFDFHRKKTTTLVDGRFEEGLLYRVRFEGKIHPADGWTDVLGKFKQWLSKGNSD